MCMFQHTRGFQSFDINDNKVLLAYFLMCWSTLCNMQENLKHSWRAGSFHSPNQVKWHCIKGLFSFIKLRCPVVHLCFKGSQNSETQRQKKSEWEREDGELSGSGYIAASNFHFSGFGGVQGPSLWFQGKCSFSATFLRYL
jgi:hypothetical protein